MHNRGRGLRLSSFFAWVRNKGCGYGMLEEIHQLRRNKTLSKMVAIPNNERPMWECTINGVDYAYPAGVTMEVPDMVAELIEGAESVRPKPKPPEDPGGDASAIDALIDRSITEISSNATQVGYQACSGCSKLTKVDFPAATTLVTESFYDCYQLTTVDFPAVTNIMTSAFQGCKALTTAKFPAVTKIASRAFYSCSLLTALILRGETRCILENKNAFDYCYHFHGTVNSTNNPDGLKDGYIYVPSDLVATYQAATNWSTFSKQFRALEDYTVDGTITGELDPSKI